MRTSAALLPFAAVALVVVVAAHEVDRQHQARHLQVANNGMRLEKLVRRQSLADAALSIANPAADTAAAAATTEAAAATTTSAAPAAVTTSAAPVVEDPTSAAAETSLASAATTTQAQVTTSATTEAAVTTTSAAPTTEAQTTTPAAAASSSSAKAPVSASSAAESQASSVSDGVETLTSTSVNSASSQSGTASSSAASSSASSGEDNSSGGSSGINKPTLIVIIVVASSIALVAAIWTIIRKTAFSPSRRFEAKLAPIDFVTGRRDRDSFDGGADAILAHGRTGSVMSGQMSERHGPSVGYAASLGRSDSGKGSLRTTGSIRGGGIPYNPQPTAYSGPAYYQQPYHGQQQQQFSAAQPGYPSEQAFGYSNLQRGASSRTDLSRGGSARQPATPAGAYDYAAQQRQLAQSRSQSRGPY